MRLKILKALVSHSTTTRATYYPILTPSPPQMDVENLHPNIQQLRIIYMIPTLCHVTKRGLSTDLLTLSSCPRSY